MTGLGLGWFGLVVCSLLGWWFGAALLALLPGVTCQCWQLVGFALLEWLFVLDFGLRVKLGYSGCNRVRVTRRVAFSFSVAFFFENALRVLRR